MRSHQLSILALALALGCDDTGAAPREIPAQTSEPAAQPVPTPRPRAPGPVDESWVARRVEAARTRLGQTEAGQVVWAGIEAHGGLNRWLGSGTIELEFDYKPVGNPDRRMHTFQKIDLWSARAWHQEVGVDEAEQATFAWDGHAAWIAPSADKFPSTARFWALTPYYFVGMPFVVADPGANHELLEDAELDGQIYKVVKVTYESGTGDAPDDYYVLYFHPETHKLAALRYVVSYPGFFEQGEHSPEKLMRYTELAEHDGVLLAGRLDTSRWDAEAGEPKEVVTEIVVSRIRLGQTYSADLFAAPEGIEASAEIERRTR